MGRQGVHRRSHVGGGRRPLRRHEIRTAHLRTPGRGHHRPEPLRRRRRITVAPIRGRQRDLRGASDRRRSRARRRGAAPGARRRRLRLGGDAHRGSEHDQHTGHRHPALLLREPLHLTRLRGGVGGCRDTPLGPCRRIYSTPVLPKRGGMLGPGSQTPLQLPDGSWRLAFHAWDNVVGYDSGGERTLHLLPLTFPGGNPQAG